MISSKLKGKDAAKPVVVQRYNNRRFMGFTKRLLKKMEEDSARGYSVPERWERFLCANHYSDKYLNAFIRKSGVSFENKNTKPRVEGDAFDDFLFRNYQGTVKDCGLSIIQGVIEFLDLCDVRNNAKRYSRTSLLNYLASIDVKNKEEFLSKVMSWAMLATTGSNEEERIHLKEEIYQYLLGTLLPLFGKGEATEVANCVFLCKCGGKSGRTRFCGKERL